MKAVYANTNVCPTWVQPHVSSHLHIYPSVEEYLRST